MAEERNIILNVGIQSEDAVAGLNQIDQGLKKVDQSVDKIGADSGELQSFESKLADINKKVNSGELNFQQLRKTIKDYQGIAFEAGRTSPVGQQALADAANLQDRLTDLDNEVKRLAHDGANLQAAMQLGQGVLAGFTAFKGVTAALGIENEDLMKTMTQLQGASSALMAVEQLRTTLEKESFLRIKAKTIATKALAGVTKTYTVVQKALNVAMKANPIGMIIIAITALISVFVLLYNNIQSIIDAFIALGQWLGLISDEEAELEAQRVSANEESEKRHKENIARLKGERDAQQKVLEQIEKRKKVNQETTDLELLQAKARGAGERELFNIQKKANDLKLEMAKQEIEAKAEIMRINREMAQAEYDRWKAFLETQALQSGFTEEQIAKELKQLEEAKVRFEEEEAAQIVSNERALATLEANNTIFINDHIEKQSDKAKKLKDIDDKAAAQRLKDALKENSKLEKIAKDLENRKLSATKRLNKIIRDENATDSELKINQLRDQYAKELELLDDSIAQEAALKMKLHTALQDEIKRINDEAKKEADEERKAELEAQIQQAIDLANVGLEKLNEINDILNEIGERRLQKIQDQRDADLDSLEKQKKKELNIEGKTAQQKAQIEHKFAMQEFKIKKQAAEAEDKIARRQFQRNKALKIAEIAINTAAAVMQALGSIPPPASFVVAGVSGAIGIAQAAMVASTKFQGTSGGIQPPNFTMPNVNEDADGNNNGTNNRTTADDGTNVDDLINGQQTIMISQVEINDTRDEMANVQDVATI
jgi:hypothetical protein